METQTTNKVEESRARTFVKSVTTFVEFLTDHFVGTSGHILIKASPLLAPLPSAIFILIALLGYAGNNRWLMAASFVLTAVIEGLGYSAVHARNAIEDHNRRNPNDRVNGTNAVRAVQLYFVVTLGVIFGFETVPAWVDVAQKTGTFSHAIVSTVILIFPVFSYVGSNIYSLMDILERIKKKADERVDDVLFDLRNEIARLKQAILDAESKHKDELASVAKSGEIATAKAVEIATRQLAAEHKVTVASLETELRILRGQGVSPTPVNRQKRRLTETEENYCREVAKHVGENEVRTWSDLAKIANWSEKTSQRYGQLAKATGYIHKDKSGLYRIASLTEHRNGRH